MNKCSNSLKLREMQIPTVWRGIFYLQKYDSTSVGKAVKKQALSYMAGGNAN
jgi:hypothetical protein